MLFQTYIVKIIDFGLSSFLGVGTIVTNYTKFLSTELYKDNSTIHKSYQSDAYSVGEIFYCLLFKIYYFLLSYIEKN